MKMLKAQPPRDAKVLCCDYNTAEYNSRLGVPGATNFGGAYLCLAPSTVQMGSFPNLHQKFSNTDTYLLYSRNP